MFKCKTSPEVGGMGHSVKRKEDARFLHGKGNYVINYGNGTKSVCLCQDKEY